jgi:hypothetical protein
LVSPGIRRANFLLCGHVSVAGYSIDGAHSCDGAVGVLV